MTAHPLIGDLSKPFNSCFHDKTSSRDLATACLVCLANLQPREKRLDSVQHVQQACKTAVRTSHPAVDTEVAASGQGQRLQVVWQKPPGGAEGLNMNDALH